MQTTITARHFEITDQLREYVDRKAGKLERYSHYIINLELVLSKGSPLEEVEGKVHLKHELLTARAQSKDLLLGISEVVDRLLTQMKRHDERMQDRKKAPPPPPVAE
jgi:putative sigma-54 modulation protein